MLKRLQRKIKRIIKKELRYQAKRKIYAAFGGGALAAIIYFLIK